MIRFRDSLTLALTKLRTRKVRLLVTIVVSGLLLSGLMAASFITRGAFASIENFNKEGLGKRFIVSGTDIRPIDTYSKPEVLELALQIHKDTVARKKAEAKRLGLEYNAAQDPSPVSEIDTPNGKERYLSPEIASGKQAVEQYLSSHPYTSKTDFEKLAAQYNPTATYSSKVLRFMPDGRLQVLKDGKESFNMAAQNKGPAPEGSLESFTYNWNIMSSSLLEPFVLKGQNLQTDPKGNIPIVIPISAAEKLLKLKGLPATANAAEKLERTKEIRQKITDITFNVCYRNSTSASLVDNAIAVQQEVARNKDKKDYKKPELIYGLPTEACGDVPIAKDVRNKEQRTMDNKQEEFERIFGKPAASQSTIGFRVVGIVPDYSFSSATGVVQIISSLVISSLGSGWFTPSEEALKHPLAAKVFSENGLALGGSSETFFAEFKTSKEAKTFIEKATCTADYNFSDMAQDPFKKCIDEGKSFTLMAFGSNSLALEDAKKTFSKIFQIAALVVAAIGAIIMMGTVGRMIADSRRETAVFRAIGAKRLDIAQIYILYTLLISLLIGVFAFLGGSLAASIAQGKYGGDFTTQALVAYNAQDLSQTFSLYRLHVPDVLFLAALALGAGLLSVSIPLIRNLRRNPIRDMRDDT